MKIATWNVNGIRARADQFCEWLSADRPDIVCLQELKAQEDQIPPQCKLDEYHTFWHCYRAYSGVSLHIHRDLVSEPPAFSHPSFDMESRIVQAEVGDMTVASVYVPNGGKDFPAKLAFLEAMIDWARQMYAEDRKLVICGDINIARTDMDVHPKERKKNAVGQRPEERAMFEQLLDHQFVDVGRTLDPDNDELFTWWAPWRNLRARNIGWRLDYFLASTGIASRATRCDVLREVGTSDHAPVVMTLA